MSAGAIADDTGLASWAPDVQCIGEAIGKALIMIMYSRESLRGFLQYFVALDFRQLWRHVRSYLRSALGIPQLRRIFICPSHECNADCVHCYEKFLHQTFHQELSTEAIKNIIDQFHELGGFFVYFCSGELLLRPDALELIRYARARDLATSLTTNGILLNEKSIVELKEAGLTVLVVSIDSANPERHDQLRGFKGCFERATSALRIARDKGLVTMIWTYVARSNHEELQGISALGKKLNVQLVFVFLPLLSGHLFDRFDENLTPEERESFRDQFNPSLNVLLEFPSERDRCRGGGLEHICVMPSGDVTFCPPVPYSYGNIANRPIRDILKDIRGDHRRFSDCRGQCIVNFPRYRQHCNAKFMYD
jgi:MoaA/NifB/PqqE/SkfB family radical SAM enzyme